MRALPDSDARRGPQPGRDRPETLVLVAPSPDLLRAGASWVVIAQWAAAGEALFGGAVILTPDGPMTVGDARRHATLFARGRAEAPWWRRRLPEAPFTAVADLRRTRAARAGLPSPLPPDVEGAAVPFVVQHHGLFNRNGLLLARRLRVPCVVLVEALQVWEARQWGIRRPGWGGWLERVGETRFLRQADLVACVSEEVASAVQRLGVPDDRIVVAPNAADPERFAPTKRDFARKELGLEDRLAVGWVGSFRSFHALDVLFDAFEHARRSEPRATLVLIGDGPERPACEARAKALGDDRVRFTGAVDYDDVPTYLSALDVAVVPARAGEAFHYSPLKLTEYLSMGIAVVAPRVGEIARHHRHEEDVLLYEPGDTDELARAIERLLHDDALRARIGARARELQRVHGGQTAHLAAIADRLGVAHP